MTSPSQIKGVKWRQHADEEYLQPWVHWWLNKPDGTTKLQVMQALETKANSVVFRVDTVKRFIKPPGEAPGKTYEQRYDDAVEAHGKAMGDIVDAIAKAQASGIKLDFYLWARIWLERHGKAKYGTPDDTVDAVEDWFTPILTKAKTAGVLDHIKGIALIEVNCDNMHSITYYANRIAKKFNDNPNWNSPDGTPFFKSRSFLMPGAGFGLDFRGVGNDSGFLRLMAKRCAHFAFIYKFMEAAHESVTAADYERVEINGKVRIFKHTDLDPKSEAYKEALRNSMSEDDAGFTVEDRKAFLNHFGLKQLIDYVNTYKNTYPTACNIVFWGDCWDGISKTPRRSRQALHSLLVCGDGTTPVNTNTGYFFNLAAPMAEAASVISASRFYLLDDKLAYNQSEGKSDGLTVSEEWERWPTANPGY